MGKLKTYKILTILLPMQWAFIQLLSRYPDFVETYYSNALYKWISMIYRLLLGWIPFSVGDIFYTVLVIIVLINIVKSIKKRTLFSRISLFKTGAYLSVIYFLFNISWGLNYYRAPLYKSLKINNSNYTVEELYNLTSKLIEQTNSIHFSITQNDTLIVENPSKKNTFNSIAKQAYKNLEGKYPFFEYDFVAAKKSIFSLPLTYMGFAGYLNPFTNEAQVNGLIPKNNYPATLCHEIAHQTGISSESEANFVGYLAAINSDDPYFKYSGFLMATRYCLFDLYRRDTDKFEELRERLNPGILEDIQMSIDFWRKYQNWSEKYFKSAYDSYLKANKQKDGIKGYNKMVKQLVNYYNSNEF